jgi:hypothetical protein
MLRSCVGLPRRNERGMGASTPAGPPRLPRGVFKFDSLSAAQQARYQNLLARLAYLKQQTSESEER